MCKEQGIHLQVKKTIVQLMQSLDLSIIRLCFRPIAVLVKMRMDLYLPHPWWPRWSPEIVWELIQQYVYNVRLLWLRFHHGIAGCTEVRQDPCPSVTQVKVRPIIFVLFAIRSYIKKYDTTKHCWINFYGCRWGLEKGYTVLPRSSSPSHVRENFEVLHWRLEEEDIQLLDTLGMEETKYAWNPAVVS